MIGLPFSRKYQKEMGFPKEGDVVGGFSVESVSVEHVAAYTDKLARYEYPTKLIVEGVGTVNDVKEAFKKFFEVEKTILSSYGNPYHCEPGKMYVQSLGENRFRIEASGSCVRVLEDEPQKERDLDLEKVALRAYEATFELNDFQAVEEGYVPIGSDAFSELIGFFKNVPATWCSVGETPDDHVYLSCETDIGEFRAIKTTYEIKEAIEAYEERVKGPVAPPEVDRVWEVTPGVFAPPVTYVLSCKWGLVSRAHVDDFLEVLRWSKGFGVDTPDGHDVKQGVVGVFAASTFNPRETVQLKDGTKISLTQYASRRNLQLITAADFNKMLREKGCPKEATVQKICRAARHEAQVRETLDSFWEKPREATEVLSRLRRDNKDLYKFEKRLESNEENIR